MAPPNTITIAFMDAPFERSTSTTVFRLIDAALRRGIGVNVFAYEGAVATSFRHQQQHANAIHGRNDLEENHPLPASWVTQLIGTAERRGLRLNWVNCGLCVDERGVNESVPGVQRGSPADFWKMVADSDNALAIGTY